MKQHILALFLSIAAAGSGVGLAVALMWPDPVWRALIALAVPLTVAQAWLQLDVTLATAELAPRRYGGLLTGRSVVGVLIGGWLAWIGLGARAPLIGLLTGAVVAWLAFGLVAWRGIRPRWPARSRLREYGSYGLPLVATFALGWIMASSDRALIAWLMGESATGMYAAGYDLAQQTLGLALMVVNTAAYPIVLRRLESEGQGAATRQLERNGELVVALGLAGAVGLIALAPAIVEVVVGAEFRAGAVEVVPWIAAATAVAGIKAFHLDIAFHLARRPRGLLASSAVAALANVLLNLWLIPRFGILGAAWATLAAFLLAGLGSGWLGARAFAMPAAAPIVARGLAVAALAFTGAWAVTQIGLNALLTVLLGTAAGAALALVGMALLDVAGARSSLAGLVRGGLGARVRPLW